LPLVRDVALKNDELNSWLTQDGAFKLPAQVGRANLVGSLRLLYQVWDPSDDLAHSDRMLMSKSSLDLLTASLDLPRCFPFDFANRKPVPIRLKVNKTSSGDNLGIAPLFLISCPRTSE
jgi:hypothetical protein